MVTQQRPFVAGWDGPLGLIFAGNPHGAAVNGSVMAVAVATAFLPGATLDLVIQQVLDHASCLGNQAHEFAGRLKRLLEIAAHCEDVFALREPFYREFLVTFPPWEAVFTLEMIPAALALCHISRGDAAQALIGAANLGRDSDTIGSMVGELMGALHGVATFPASWVEQLNCLNPTPTLSVMADELATIIEEQARAEQQRSAEVLRLASA